jgi:nucleoside-diphosphate-sugar epimerase
LHGFRKSSLTEFSSSLTIDTDQGPQALIDKNDLASFSAVVCLIGGRRQEVSGYMSDLRSVDLLVQAAGIVGVPVVHIGSASEVGLPEGATGVLEHREVAPFSEYGKWKLRATQLVLSGSPDNCVLRLFNVAGFPLKTGTAFHMLLSPFLSSSDPVVVTTPGLGFVRDYLDVRTICQTISEVCDARLSGLFNLSSGQGKSATEIVDWAQSIRRCQVEIRNSGRIDDSVIVGSNYNLAQSLGHPLECDWEYLRTQFVEELERGS